MISFLAGFLVGAITVIDIAIIIALGGDGDA